MMKDLTQKKLRDMADSAAKASEKSGRDMQTGLAAEYAQGVRDALQFLAGEMPTERLKQVLRY